MSSSLAFETIASEVSKCMFYCIPTYVKLELILSISFVRSIPYCSFVQA